MPPPGRVLETALGGNMTTRAVLVWDLSTRIFHWALVIAVVVSYVTGGEEGSGFVVHTVSGYVVALLLLFRLIWGFWGSAHSRFPTSSIPSDRWAPMSGGSSGSSRRSMSATTRSAVGWWSCCWSFSRRMS